MLKIKDNVDLKELEKFGYNNKYSDDYEKVIGYAETIWVESDTRNIWLEDSMSYFDEDVYIDISARFNKSRFSRKGGRLIWNYG